MSILIKSKQFPKYGIAIELVINDTGKYVVRSFDTDYNETIECRISTDKTKMEKYFDEQIDGCQKNL